MKFRSAFALCTMLTAACTLKSHDIGGTTSPSIEKPKAAAKGERLLEKENGSASTDTLTAGKVLEKGAPGSLGSPTNHAAGAVSVPPGPPNPKASQTSGVAAAPASECPTGISAVQAPVFVQEHGFFVTALRGACVPAVTPTSTNAAAALLPGTQWVAMGFPCTGKGGRVRWLKNYMAPTYAAFVIPTDCPMDPPSSIEVASAGSKLFASEGVRTLISYTPMAVQYWEIPGFEESDVGFVVELRSVSAIQALWPQFLKQKPIRVHLYGRENAWTSEKALYFAEADITQTIRGGFRLSVVSAKRLSEDESMLVQKRCATNLARAGRCDTVFGEQRPESH